MNKEGHVRKPLILNRSWISLNASHWMGTGKEKGLLGASARLCNVHIVVPNDGRAPQVMRNPLQAVDGVRRDRGGKSHIRQVAIMPYELALISSLGESFGDMTTDFTREA
jgi:hypothetical protein